MENIYFITGNAGKFREAKAIMPEIEQIDLDLPEIQELDPKSIIEAKLKEASRQMPGKQFFCEDVSLCFENMNGFPGPLIKWMLKSLGNEGIAKTVAGTKAKACAYIGYTDGKDIRFFKGELGGKIVSPKGESFGWDPIFQPDGYDKTLGELPQEKKNEISMRKHALEALKVFLS
jgi:non-canonical purine NTP pyrophosphatase (RdgB/HAM1 family)